MDFAYFEQYPILLVAFIVVTVELWNLAKAYLIHPLMKRLMPPPAAR